MVFCLANRQQKERVFDNEHKNYLQIYIASYALLLMLYAKEAGLQPGILRGEFHDTHVYKNHLPQAREQLTRTPKKLPTVEIPDDNWCGMLNWAADGGFKLNNYVYHEALRGAVAR